MVYLLSIERSVPQSGHSGFDKSLSSSIPVLLSEDGDDDDYGQSSSKALPNAKERSPHMKEKGVHTVVHNHNHHRRNVDKNNKECGGRGAHRVHLGKVGVVDRVGFFLQK